MSIPVRNAVRVLLLNNNSELLLMCVEDFDISTIEGARNKRFWCTIGGGIEVDETIQEAALREIHEETGIAQDAIELGPVVWVSDVDLMLKGMPTRLHENFIVAKTMQNNVALHIPTEDERLVVKRMEWFSLEKIQQSDDVIFPTFLLDYLPDVLAGKYPDQPVEFTLDS